MLKTLLPMGLRMAIRGLQTPNFAFTHTRKGHSSQMILHTPEQIENMITRKSLKDQGKEILTRPWKTYAGSDTRKFRVSLVGLPNCGKSSLFNCLVGERIAVVDKLEGMTRDRKQFDILQGLASVIDTPGVEAALSQRTTNQGLKQQIFKQTVAAIHESNLILFVVDGKQTITRRQIEFAKYIKTFGSHSKIVLVVNKCDNLYDEGEVTNEISKLGFETILHASAQEGSGVIEILQYIDSQIPEDIKNQFATKRKIRKQRFQALIKKLKAEVETYNTAKEFRIKEWESDFRKINPNPEENEDLDNQDFEDWLIRPEEAYSTKRGAQARNLRLKGAIRICFIGRPNVGKSTLINQILGEDKMVVSEVAHTTRDAIRSRIEYKGRKVELIDTAGLNTPNLDTNSEEYLRKVQISTMAHVQQSHVVVYMMDAFNSFVVDDFALIRQVIKEGRPVVIVVNKWEAVKDTYRYKAKNYLLKQIQQNLGEIHGDPLVFVSAKLSTGIDEMLDRIVMTYDKWNVRISTGMLNDWLQNFKKLQTLPKQDDHSLKINYMIQARVRPPHFVCFVNAKHLFAGHYQRFLMRNIAQEFKLDGIPLRLTLRSSNHRENKRYVPKDRKQSPMRDKMEDLKKKYGNFGL